MPEVDDYAPGTPCWVDLASTDLPAALRFYTQLFGWSAEDQGPDAGNYHLLTKEGANIAGAMGVMMEGQPSAWTSYVSVEDADATAGRIRDAGGALYVEPVDVMTLGRMAVAADPSGAVFGLWQPKDHRGADLVNEPGALNWNELNTRDLDGALAFYPTVFDWEPETHKGEMDYTEWKLHGRSVAGMMAMLPQVPAEVPSHWLVYFGTSDCDGTVATASGLGASVLAPPMDIEPGRFSVMSDPTGATFAVIQTKAA
jgi:predicted enzyme related to lactoylglutathione lyase